MTAATPRSCSIPQAAATSPNARWRVRSGRTAASRASSSAAMSAAVPRYRSETSFGLPSTQPISRRYQYGFPLITFLYRLAMALGHRPSGRRKQADTPDHRRSDLPYDGRQLIKIELARKLGLACRGLAAVHAGRPGPTGLAVPMSCTEPVAGPLDPPDDGLRVCAVHLGIGVGITRRSDA